MTSFVLLTAFNKSTSTSIRPQKGFLQVLLLIPIVLILGENSLFVNIKKGLIFNGGNI